MLSASQLRETPRFARFANCRDGVLLVACRCDAGVVERGGRVSRGVWSWCAARVVLACSRGFGKVLWCSLCVLLRGAGVLRFEKRR